MKKPLLAAGAAIAMALVPVSPGQAQGEDGAELLARLQARLLGAKRVKIESEIQAQGAAFVLLKGSAEFGERNQLQLLYAGQFGAEPAVLALTGSHRVQELRSGARSRREPAPGETNHALLISMLRGGFLHNLMRLRELQGPAGAAGGVDRAVTLDNFRPTTYVLGGELEGALSFGFDVLVEGAPAASTRLWLDPVTGLPRRREQTTSSPTGVTAVIENYIRFTVE